MKKRFLATASSELKTHHAAKRERLASKMEEASKKNIEKKKYLESGHALIGRVVSTKMKKSITVSVPRVSKHPKYGVPITKHKKFMAHDELEECNEGDKVLLRGCRPLSKRKHYVLHRVLERYPQMPEEA